MVLTTEILKRLAMLHDKDEQAITIYFSLPTLQYPSAKAQAIAREQFMERLQRLCGGSPFFTSTEFALYQKTLAEHPGHFHYFLSAGSETFQGSLPVHLPTEFVSKGYSLDLFPLLCAIESCETSLVLLAESDKARLFRVNGLDIEEIQDNAFSSDLSVHAEDSRVGWSHHIDANVEHRRDQHWRNLTVHVQRFLDHMQCRNLLIGCRNDLWGHVRRHFDKIQRRSSVIFFELQNFAMSPSETLLAAQPALEKLRSDRYLEFVEKCEESTDRSVRGFSDVLAALEKGAASKLVITPSGTEEVFECDACGRVQTYNRQACPSCGIGGLHAVSPEALLASRAILSDAVVLTPVDDGHMELRSLLRY